MMGDMEIPDELIDQLLGEYTGPEQLTGPDGLINQLRRRLIERAAGAELEQHLGYRPGAEAPEAQPNRRNGTTSKTLRTVDGPVTVELPRDRDASFEPRVVPKHTRSFDGFDDQILALYAGGMTTREIQRHLRELYGVDVSDGLISEVTASIQDDVRAWQSRPLEELYVAVYLDAMQVAIRDQQVVRKKAVYVAIGVTLEGERDCLGLWVEKTEGAPARRDARRLDRREDGHPGQSADAAGRESTTGQAEPTRVRVHPQRHPKPVRRAAGAHRRGERDVCQDAQPFRPAPFPRPARGRDPRRTPSHRDQRQPLHPHDHGSERLARRPPALALRLHAQARQLAQPGRDLLLDPRPPAAQTRRLHKRARPRPTDARLRRDLQPNSTPLQLDIHRQSPRRMSTRINRSDH